MMRPAPGTAVPVKGPVMTTKRFAGSKASMPGEISSHAILAAIPRPPRNASAYGRVSTGERRPVVRSARRIRPTHPPRVVAMGYRPSFAT